MSFESEKIMFEIYRDIHYNKMYRVVYYSELNEHNKHTEINRALAGESYFNGFIKEYGKAEAKQIIEEIIQQLNNDVIIGEETIREKLKNHIL